MERENKKVIMIYSLTGIVILLIIYLVLFVYKTLTTETQEKNNSDVVAMPQVSTNCIFNMTVRDFNNINNNTSLCSSLNKINLTDAILNGKNLNVVIYYANDITNGAGIYINDELALADDVLKVHKMGVFDNKLFITDFSETEANFVAYDETGVNVYSLKDALNSFKIIDPAFKTMNNNTFLSISNLDSNSFVFENGKISFNSTIGSCVNGISGSNYSIVYKGNTFESPTYITNITC